MDGLQLMTVKGVYPIFYLGQTREVNLPRRLVYPVSATHFVEWTMTGIGPTTLKIVGEFSTYRANRPAIYWELTCDLVLFISSSSLFKVTIDGSREIELKSDWDYASLLYAANIDGNDVTFQVWHCCWLILCSL